MNGVQLLDQVQLATPAQFHMRSPSACSQNVKVDIGNSQGKQNACAIQAFLQQGAVGFLQVWSREDRLCDH